MMEILKKRLEIIGSFSSSSSSSSSSLDDDEYHHLLFYDHFLFFIFCLWNQKIKLKKKFFLKFHVTCNESFFFVCNSNQMAMQFDCHNDDDDDGGKIKYSLVITNEVKKNSDSFHMSNVSTQ